MSGKRRVVERLILAKARVAGLGLLLAAAASAPSASADDAAGSSREDAISLQRRLTDAGCYRGAIDGAQSAALAAAVMACPDQSPVLRIETGMHTTLIHQIGVDLACRTLATASDDKTVRLWSLPDGRLERTIRLPIGPGFEGRILAAALSPDGRLLAAGGWDAAFSKLRSVSLSIVDLQSSKVRRFGAFPDVIDGLAFSPDGRRVAVGLGSNEIRVLDSVTGQELLADRSYGGSVYGLAFAPDGSLITASLDGQLRRYGSDLRMTARRAAPGGKRPTRLAIDPTGGRVGVGYGEEAPISILDVQTLARIAEADPGPIGSRMSFSVAWSRDGGTLIGGSGPPDLTAAARENFFRRFDPDGHRHGADIPATRQIMDLQPCGEGFAFALAGSSIGLIGADGAESILQGPHAADMTDMQAAFAVSADAEGVRLKLRYGQNQPPVQFDVAAGSLVDAPEVPSGYALARLEGLAVTDWHKNFIPKFRGFQIALRPHEISTALAIRPDAKGFALGTTYFVRAFDAAGKPSWTQAGPGVAWGVDFSADGQVLVAAFDDGTIRWLRATDGVELLALFVDVPTRRWVAWTPTGYYMASPGGEDLIGWQLNRGWGQEADFFPASRFSARFNRPDIVQLVLKTHDEAEAVRQANERAKRREETAPIDRALPPVIKIVSPTADGKFTGDSVDVTFSARSPSGLPIDRVDALIDGRPVEARGVAPAASQTGDSVGETRHLTIPAPAHDFELALIARSGTLVGEAAKVRLVYSGSPPAEPASVLKPKLYAVTIGVSAYADPDLRLGYAADDARGFAEVLQKQKGGLYGDVQVKTLVDGEVTRTSVVEALDWLEQQVTSRDFGVVLIAGHGVTDEKQRYWFLPADATMQHLHTSAVSQDDIERTMGALAGKAILFLDTCHANAAVARGGVAARGPVDINTIVNEFAKTENGVVTFASSQGRETSQESAAWGHGAFTEALIEGLGEGKADLLHKGSITVSELDAYIAERVKTLTEGRQHPVMSRPSTVPDFAFAVAK